GPSPLAPNLTVIHKSAAAQDGDNDVDLDAAEDAETKMVNVDRGDTLAGIIVKIGAEDEQAKAIVEALAPVFPARNLKPGQEVRFALVPAPSDTEEMEPVRVSVYGPGNAHLGTVARTTRGDFVVTDQKGAVTAEGGKQQQHATLYQSFYRAALAQ